MDLSPDQVAGIVDLFGGLAREDLETAIEELAFRAGEDPGDVDATVEDALASYHLLDAGACLVAGPVAFPALPDHADDLPHILDVPDRSVDRATLADAVADRLARDAERAVAEDDAERAALLREVSYDAEAWAPVDLSGVRETLAALEADGVAGS